MTPFLAPPPIQRHQLRRTWGQRLLLTFNIVLIAVTLAITAGLSYGGQKAAAVNRVALDRSLSERPAAEPGSRVLNVLLVGSDSSENLDPDDPVQIGRQGERLGDVIIIAHIDERTRDIALLSIPRDLWVTVADSERKSRINRTFALGGASRLINSIEENLGIPIHHFVNVDFASFEGLVEALDGVDVYFETPARDWNVDAKPVPRSQTGFIIETAGCHRLEPRQALSYVRSRYYQTQNEDGRWITDPTADLGRIKRQQDFLQSVMHQAIRRGARNPLIMADIVDVAIENVQIDQDLTAGEILDIASSYDSFEPSDLITYTYPAVDDTVSSNRVLVPLKDEAEPLVALFNGSEFDSPETVAITVHIDPDDETGRGRDIVRRLRRAGFVVRQSAKPIATTGIRIGHGSTDFHLAQLVGDVLSQEYSPELAEQSHHYPRNLTLTVGQAALDPNFDPDTVAQRPEQLAHGDVAAGTGTDQADEEAVSQPSQAEEAGSQPGQAEAPDDGETPRAHDPEIAAEVVTGVPRIDVMAGQCSP